MNDTDARIAAPTRAEHLQWCKDRALAYLPGAPDEALASFFSDMRKHPATADHIALELGALLMFGGHLHTIQQVKEFIEGTN